MNRRRWFAVLITFVVVASLRAVLFSFEERRPRGARGTFGGIEACANGELWIGRRSGIDIELTVLRWSENELSVQGQGQPRKLELAQRASLLREFAALERIPDEPIWVQNGRLTAHLAAGGKCEGVELETEELLEQDLIATLKASPIADMPVLIKISLRGRARRAEALLRRMERMAL